LVSIIPTLREGATVLRPIRVRDARALEAELIASRSWLRPWEATNPAAPMQWDTKASIRNQIANARAGAGLPFIIETDGRLAGQLNVSGMTYGSLASATIGYWVGAGFAGRGLTPTAVALATDHVFFTVGLHRMEICIRPENGPSLRVVEKLGFRYEGLRRRYIHINNDWRDHFCFALTVEEVPQGVLQRWKSGRVPPDAATVPEVDLIAARRGISLPPAR
jgi:ribosomal-protein-alanine N-acetyltransferase